MPIQAHTRSEKRRRNTLIREEYARGATAQALSDKYGLATGTIYKIANSEKRGGRSVQLKCEKKPDLTLGVGSRVVVVSNQYKDALGLKGYVEQIPSEEGGYVFVRLDGEAGRKAFYPTGLKVLG